jgi:3-phosphoshikimate 1-carboxyvinyltransferase
MNTNRTIITGLGKSNDELAVLEVLRSIGAHIVENNEHIIIQGIALNHLKSIEITVGESGLGTRMLTPMMALSSNPIKIVGVGSILERPMRFFEKVLPQLGVQLNTNDGKLPLALQGPLIPRNITVDGSLSSQFLTGLMMSYVGSSETSGEIIKIENPTSIPYIELTIQVLQDFGHDVSFDKSSIVFNGPYHSTAKQIQIEGDWSSAAFFMVAAALFGEMTFTNLNLNSAQADKAILNVLTAFGAQILHDTASGLTIKKSNFKSFHHTIKTIGVGESFLAEIIQDWETQMRNDGLKLAYLPSPGIVKLRISCYGQNQEENIKKPTNKEDKNNFLELFIVYIALYQWISLKFLKLITRKYNLKVE